jgi:hypothetical protein
MNMSDLAAPRHTDARAVWRGTRLLVATYLGVSVLTLVAIVLLRNHPAIVTAAVWIRATIVVASALLTTVTAARAARGSRPAYRRLRLISAVMVVAIAVMIALPGTFPVWLKIEQGICGLVLIGVVLQVNSPRLRSSLTAE